jgi:preprotein translocase subunit SecF
VSFLNLKSVPDIDFMGRRLFVFGLSGFMVALVILGFIVRGVPYGVDFKGGVIVEMRAPNAPSLGTIRSNLSEFLSDASVQELDTASDYLVRFDGRAFEVDKDGTLNDVRAAFGTGSAVRRLESVGPKVSDELLKSGVYAVVLALLAMLLYIWVRFEWRYGLAALCALLHDCVAVLGLYALGRIEFNETAIVAILITASYSINDTVVVFDRVRENKGRYGSMPMKALLNLSVNETLSRTLLTSLTTLAALFVLYFFGGPVISGFSLPILVGLVVGTYSSVCLASPLLLWLNQSFEPSPLVNQNQKKDH